MNPRVTRLTVESDNARIDVELADEGAGEYVVVRDSVAGGEIGIDPEEWVGVRNAIDQLMAGVKS